MSGGGLNVGLGEEGGDHGGSGDAGALEPENVVFIDAADGHHGDVDGGADVPQGIIGQGGHVGLGPRVEHGSLENLRKIACKRY